MKIILIVAALVSVCFCADTLIATTQSGKKVLLFPNKTWKMAEVKAFGELPGYFLFQDKFSNFKKACFEMREVLGQSPGYKKIDLFYYKKLFTDARRKMNVEWGMVSPSDNDKLQQNESHIFHVLDIAGVYLDGTSDGLDGYYSKFMDSKMVAMKVFHIALDGKPIPSELKELIGKQ